MKTKLLFALGLVFALVAITAHSYAAPATLHMFHGPGLPTLAIVVSVTDTTRARAAFQRAAYIISCIIQRNSSVDIMASRGQVITEQPIVNGTSTYIFDLWDKTLQGIRPVRPLVRGVKDNDLFLAIGLRLLIDSRTQTQANVIVQTWPNPTVFAPSGATTLDLWVIYNAKWIFQVDRVVYVDGDTTRKFLKVPQFNGVSTNASGLVPATSGYDYMNEFDGKRYLEVDPYPIISGRTDNVFRLDLALYPGWNGAADVAEYANLENVISFEFDGYVLKNCYKFMPFFNGNLSVDSQDDWNTFSGQAAVAN